MACVDDGRRSVLMLQLGMIISVFSSLSLYIHEAGALGLGSMCSTRLLVVFALARPSKSGWFAITILAQQGFLRRCSGGKNGKNGQ